MKLKRFLSLVLTICIMLTVMSFPAMAATSGTCGDNLTWTLDDTGTLTISGIGAMTNYSYSSAPWYSDRSSIKTVVIEDGVTSIGDYVFYNCRSLESITIPNSVTSIGDYAFYWCTSLTSVTIHDSVTEIGYYAFDSCSSLTAINVDSNNLNYSSIDGVLFDKNQTTLIAYPCGKSGAYTIPDSVTSIGSYAFSSCSSLTAVTIPDSVTSIDDWAFYNCTSLTSVSIGDSVTSIGRSAFSYCYSLTDVYYNGTEEQRNAITIGPGNDKLTSATWHYVENEVPVLDFTYTITDGEVTITGYTGSNTVVEIPAEIEGYPVTSIGNKAFHWWTSLTSVTIPDSVTEIGDYAFSYCYSLTSITIPDSVTEIGGYAFEDCSSLKSITIPDSVTSIGDRAFYKCTSLTAINVDSNNLNYSSIDGVLFDKNQTALIAYPCGKSGAYTIPDSVTSIDDSAFSDCTSLTAVTIPDSVTSIGRSAFSGCSSLTSIIIPDSVTSIGDYAFYYCDSLTSITIPDSVTSIGSNAFYNCTSLTDVYYYGTEEQKAEISISSNNNSYLTNATWHYVLCEENGHTYDNSCDTSCNVCGTTRTTTHVYDNACDTSCNICGATREVPDHVYDNACDADCNKCGAIRTITHKYDNGCDATCNVCGSVRTPSDHTYDNDCDIDCNECGDTRAVTASGTCGTNLTWTLYENGTLTISGTGPMKDYSYSSAPWYSNRSSIKTVVIGNGVTSIGEYAFNWCTSLRSVTISDSVTEIGSRAFPGCIYLTSVTIPDSVTKIGDDAFQSCNSLTSVTIPDSVTWISSSAFSACSSLTAINVDSNNPNYSSIDGVLFDKNQTTLIAYPCGKSGAYTIPDSVTEIGSRAFPSCNSLTSVTIGDSVTSIDSDAFYCCYSLTAINVDSNNPNYSSIDGVLFDKNQTTLIAYPCGKSGAYTIPDSVTSIGEYAFHRCTSLTSITIPDSVTSIGSHAFSGCTSLESITIPDSVTSIGYRVFYCCDSLTSVTIGDSVTSIGSEAFYCCKSLTSITIPDSVTSIGYRAFYNCDSLTSITIPDSVTSIGSMAFYNCSSLTDVYYNGTKSQKNAISIGSYNTNLKNATWHYVLCEENGHTYDNACDSSCNVCGETRTVGDHVYDNDCDTNCNECDETRTVGDHVYDNDCDIDCNVCGDIRTITHTYDNACDTSCNECGDTRTVAGHVYDNDYDSTCNECGDVRKVVDPNAPTFVVESKTARVGSTFTVAITTKNNIGIVSLKLMLGYDADILELVSIEEANFEGTSFGPLTNNPIAINWEDVLNPNNTTNGTVALVTFKVKDTAVACDTEIVITYDPEDVYDENFDNVAFAVEAGTVTIIEYIPGDVNSDGTVNNKDLGMLRQYLNGWGNTIDLRAADVNRDGKVNNKDLGILRQYLNGWDVVLK